MTTCRAVAVCWQNVPPLFGLITRDWHMLLLGFLFALGFDTATEIGMLGISGAQASEGMSICLIMVFPLLFAAGMALIDTPMACLCWALTTGLSSSRRASSSIISSSRRFPSRWQV